jgi:TolB-like protein/predicted Zn-dependent protease
VKTGNFFSELKRRNVYKVAVAYVVVSWLIIQAASILLPTFEAPAWMMKVVVAFLILGFPVALILSWIFEITPEGIKGESEVAPSQHTGHKIVEVTVVLAALAAGLLAFQLLRSKSTTPGPSEAGTTITEKSIAVLPFENFSEDKGFAFFADGVQDEILTDLAKIADLKVISRTSVMQYKNKAKLKLSEIAQALRVAHVLEGGVQRSANRVRVSAQLIDARNDTHIWAEKYEGDLADVFAIQSKIAQAIADQLRAKLSPGEKNAINQRPTADIAAHDLYLRAKKLLYDGEFSPLHMRENLFEMVQLLNQAVERDPAFLLAHCQLASAHDLIYFFNYDHTESRLKLAEASIENATRLQPKAGETYLARAIHFYWGLLDFNRAKEALTEARHSLPNDVQIDKFLGLIDQRQGRWDDAVQNLARSVELDPQNIDAIGNLAQVYFNIRRYDAAIAMFDRIAVLDPENPATRTYRASVQFFARAETAPLRAALNAIEAEGPAAAADVAPLAFDLARDERDPAAAARAVANIPRDGYTDPNSVPYPHAWFEGIVAKLRQDMAAAQSAFTTARSEAERIVASQPENAKPLSVLALIDAQLGQKDKAVREGRTAYELLPIAKDAVDGPLLNANLANVYALVGEKDLALKELETLSKIPCGPTYGELRLDPEWDALRSDARFEKIVASLAPKEAASPTK